jgi:hypothetical protein
MGYLDLALEVVKENFEGKERQNQNPFPASFSEGSYEINELNEKSPCPDTGEDLARSFQELFEHANSELVAAYIPGTLEMIREDFPDLARETQEAEDGVNEIWLKARAGEENFEAFRAAVDRWKTLHLRGIRFFSLTERAEG